MHSQILVAPEGSDDLVAPVAVRMIDLEAPLTDVALPKSSSMQPYRSLLAVARFNRCPPVVGTFVVDAAGGVTRERLAHGLRRRLESELYNAGRDSPHTRSRRRSNEQQRLPHPPAPMVSVVVPTCANPQALERCLQSIFRSDYDNFEVIVVENRPQSSDTARMLAGRFSPEPRLRYVEEPRRGASRARNAGLAQAKGEIVAFTDDDVVVDSGWIAASVEAVLGADDIACVSGLILPLELESETQLLLEQFAGFAKGPRRAVFRLPDARQDNPLFPYCPGAIGSGASIVMRTAIARDLGGFDTALGPATPAAGGEDLDLFIRVLRGGHAVAYEPSAIVWHQHPDGMERLRRQVYRYGVGLGAMLAKQLIAGPKRSDFVRAVPAGVRYARDPTSRKNVGKPNHYPRELTWRERAGVAVGPAAYVLSALLVLLRRLVAREPATTPATRSWREVQLSSGKRVPLVWFERDELSGPRAQRPAGLAAVLPPTAAALSIAAPLSVAAGLPSSIRLALVLAFMCLAPGTAFLAVGRGRSEPGLAVGISLAVAAVVAQLMLWTGVWAPRPVLFGLSAACLLALTPILRGITAGRVRTVRAQAAGRAVSRLRASARATTPALALHGAVLTLALVLWILALLGTDLSRMAGMGLLNAMPATYFLAFALLVVGFTAAVSNGPLRPKLLGAYVLAMIVVLHATAAVLYGEPRYAWVYKHLGVINAIATTGHADRQVDVYNNWPAFFAANAWLSRLSGVAPISYAGWAQVFFNLVNVIAVRFALRGLTRDERLLWTGTFLFVIGNWVGQDYLAPQAFGFALSLVVLGICLRCGPPAMAVRARRRRRPLWLAARLERLLDAALPPRAAEDPLAPPPCGGRMAILAGGVCFLAVLTSHQLSPMLIVMTVAALAVFTRRVPLWVPAAMLALEAWWVALAWPFLVAHFALIDVGAGGAAAPGRNMATALPGAELSFYAPAAVMALMGAIAVVGFVRRLRAGYRDMVGVCLIGAPIVAVIMQSYGGEGVYRGYLFALPWLALFAAYACAQSPTPIPRVRISAGPLSVAATAISLCLLVAYFGSEMTNRIPGDDVAAAKWYEQHAPPGSFRVNLASNAPDRLTARYALVSLDDPPSLLENAGFAGHRLGARDIPRLEAYINAQGRHRAYVVLTLGQENYARFNGLLPAGSVVSFAQAIERSRAFRLVYRRPTAWIFEYQPGGAATGGSR